MSCCIGHLHPDALSVSFLKIQRLRWLGGGSCFVFRNASVSVARSGLIVACRDLSNIVSFKLLGLNDTEEVKYRNARLSH